jgi:putative exosortase-associated protein (TIGR04073 family)
MKNRYVTLFVVLNFLMLLSPVIQAYEEDQVNRAYSHGQVIDKTHRSYGARIGEKAKSGIINVTTAILEVPKNIINTTNESNILFGLTGGTVKGLLHMMGRMGAGITDLTTFLFPTQPILEPAYPWQDFDKDTQYKAVFRFDSGANPPSTTQ